MPAIPPTTLDPDPPPVGRLLASERKRQSLSLQALANLSGVSKSMISQIENAQVNPTLAVIWRLARALNLTVDELFGGGAAHDRDSFAPLLLTAENTPVMGSPEQGWRLQILSPVESADRAEFYMLHLERAGAMESHAHEPGCFETLSVADGVLEVTVGAEAPVRLERFQSARYRADAHHVIRAHEGPATAYLAVHYRESLRREVPGR